MKEKKIKLRLLKIVKKHCMFPAGSRLQHEVACGILLPHPPILFPLTMTTTGTRCASYLSNGSATGLGNLILTEVCLKWVQWAREGHSLRAVRTIKEQNLEERRFLRWDFSTRKIYSNEEAPTNVKDNSGSNTETCIIETSSSDSKLIKIKINITNFHKRSLAKWMISPLTLSHWGCLNLLFVNVGHSSRDLPSICI